MENKKQQDIDERTKKKNATTKKLIKIFIEKFKYDLLFY